jgi:radical SAM protein with 4Fe4S-binding SPASM domain
MNDTFAVLSDGTCTFCWNEYEGELNLGNANEYTLEDIFNDEKTSYIREIEKQGIFVENRCKICRGKLVSKKDKIPISSQNPITDYYVLKTHFSRYGLKSSARKIIATLKQRHFDNY